MDDIGFRLIEIVQQDIKYKLHKDTSAFKYVHVGSKGVSIKTIYWNNGRPSFDLENKLCRGTSYTKEDIWQLNVVKAPEPLASQCMDGRWVLLLE